MSPNPDFSRVQVTLVHSEACHYCDDAGAVLAEFAREFPLDIRLVALDSPEGGEAVATHRPAMSPLVLIDGRFFSAGRLPRKKLRALLDARAKAEGANSHGR